MVKLASARESRLYGPWLARNRWEYINAGLYFFATILLLCGFVSELSSMSAKSGLVIVIISLMLVTLVNGHDLLAHMAGIDYRLQLMGCDVQLGLVEFVVPVVMGLGSVLFLMGVFFVFIQAEKGRGYFRLERHALNMLIAGPILWVIGSIHNACQIYERADGHVQILQESVQIPFLMGSLLFAIGAILNKHEHVGLIHHGLGLLGKSWIWLGIFGSLVLLIGGLMNLIKVFKMQQMDGVRLEKLRGGAQERLTHERDGSVPLILEEQRRRKRESEMPRPAPMASSTSYKDVVPAPVPVPVPASTPYKDVLVGQS